MRAFKPLVLASLIPFSIGLAQAPTSELRERLAQVNVARGQADLAIARTSQALARIVKDWPDTAPTGLNAEQGPPVAWQDKDPADSLYRRARAALNRAQYGSAASLFRDIRLKYVRSAYAADAYYWEAYANFRRGGTEALRAALEALQQQHKQFPAAATTADARNLEGRIHSVLARQGDEVSAESVVRTAEDAAKPEAAETGPARASRAARVTRSTGRGGSCHEDDNDMRVAALNALLQMDADRAIPILKKVLARRDEGSECLRRKAVFLVSQHETSETETILLSAARSDPDEEVRQQAVFWLSQTGSDRAVAALDSILRSSSDVELQKKAVFALAQMNKPRAHQIIREFAERGGANDDVQEQAIFWLGQEGSTEDAEFLRTLYKRLKSERVKEKVLFSLSQMEGKGTSKWLVDIASDPTESIEMRKKALFWAGQSGTSLPELFGLYDRLNNREMREQLIFVYSQRSEKAAVDRLIQIAKTEKDPELRKKALFWLSQSGDPRVAELLQEILEKP